MLSNAQSAILYYICSECLAFNFATQFHVPTKSRLPSNILLYLGMWCFKLLEYISIHPHIYNWHAHIHYILHGMLLHTNFQGHALCVPISLHAHTSNFVFFIQNTPLSDSWNARTYIQVCYPQSICIYSDTKRMPY